MQTFHDIATTREAVWDARARGEVVGFVPTMGNLHDGHIKLVETAREHCDKVIASIFVNPLQFGENEDFDAYPRTLAQDTQRLEDAGTDWLFAPSVQVMYPEGKVKTNVIVDALAKHHCGASRPGHFDGVGTVVSKLFHIVPAQQAFFGKKDFQQLAIIRQMVNDLSFDINILGVDTVRDADGLALSSRNGYLTSEQRQLAPHLYKILQSSKAQILEGRRDFAELAQQATAELNGLGFVTDYFNVADALSLEFASAKTSNLVVLAAARLGATRLIDNIEIELDQTS